MKKEIKTGKIVRVNSLTLPFLDGKDKKDKKDKDKTIKPKKETFTVKNKKSETPLKSRTISSRNSSLSDSKYNELKHLISKLEKRVITLETTIKKIESVKRK